MLVFLPASNENPWHVLGFTSPFTHSCLKNASSSPEALMIHLCASVSVQMSAVGITENVKGDSKKFEVWYNGREEVYIIQVS